MLTVKENQDEVSIDLQGVAFTMQKKNFLQMAVDIIIAERRMRSYKDLAHE